MNGHISDESVNLQNEWLRNVVVSDDACSFRKLFELFFPALCIYAKRYIPDRSIREDLVQQVFYMVWVNRKKINCSISARRYLFTCVKNASLNYVRDLNKHEFISISLEDTRYYSAGDDLFLLNELESLLEKALNKLPMEYRIAFEMSRLENKSTIEISEIMGISVRTVERYRNKAIDLLRNELKDYLPLLCLIIGNRFIN